METKYLASLKTMANWKWRVKCMLSSFDFKIGENAFSNQAYFDSSTWPLEGKLEEKILTLIHSSSSYLIEQAFLLPLP